MTSWTPGTKSATPSFTNSNKSSIPSWTPGTKTTKTSDLLLENNSYLLLESGFKIILEQSSLVGPTWTSATRS